MKNYLQSAALFLLLLMMQKSSAQITGDDTVCAGNFYTYSVSIAGAASYQWTVPPGWYNLQGQGTSQITVNCNVSIGNLCVEGFDAGGASLGTQCLVTLWGGGGGGSGWDVQPNSISYCLQPPGYPPLTMLFVLVPNGSGGGGGCGSCGGLSNPNIILGIYDPFGVFLGKPDSTPVTLPNVPGMFSLHVYAVDTSAGINFPQAVAISGGCGGGGASNGTIDCNVTPPNPLIDFQPQVPCVGSTVWVGCFCSFFFSATAYSGCVDLGNNLFQILSSPYELMMAGYDLNGCYFEMGPVAYYANSCPDNVSGDTVVCAGNTYTFNANLPPGHTCSWIFPPGWYDITGQYTTVCTATCNTIDGDVCAVIKDENNFTFDTLCVSTHFGDGASQGWNVQPSEIKLCAGNTSPFVASVINNGTGGGGSCAPGCGNGVLHPNIIYGVYDNAWPGGTFIAMADSLTQINLPSLPTQYYVYMVDTTNGLNAPLAILISGGCNVGVINNIIAIDSVPTPVVAYLATSPGCVGDTVILLANDSSQSATWYNTVNLLLLDSVSNPLYAVVTGLNPSVEFTATDTLSGCAANGSYSMNNQTCFYPVASFSSNKTVFCLKQYVDFYDMTSNNPTSWQWTFTGASPSTSVLQNPDSIYYGVNGSYDVQLIACNSFICDTILLPGYIVEYSAPPTPVITVNGGVLYCTPAATYAWYAASNPTVVLSTDSFYIPTQVDAFYVIITDSSGCSAISLSVSNTGIGQFYLGNEFALNEISENIFEVTLKSKHSDTEIFITDMYGRMVANQKASNHVLFNLTGYSKGIYLLTVNSGASFFSRKLLVH